MIADDDGGNFAFAVDEQADLPVYLAGKKAQLPC